MVEEDAHDTLWEEEVRIHTYSGNEKRKRTSPGTFSKGENQGGRPEETIFTNREKRHKNNNTHEEPEKVLPPPVLYICK